MSYADSEGASAPNSGQVAHTYLTPREVAGRLNVCMETLRNWRGRGVGLRFCRFGNRYRYRLEDVQAFERSFHSAAEADAARGSSIAA